MRLLAGGVTIVATAWEGERSGLTATAVCSLALNPPRVLASVNMQGRTYEMLAKSRIMSVNMLAQDHAVLAERFARKRAHESEDRFVQSGWCERVTGAPVLPMHLEGAYEALPKGASLPKRGALRGQLEANAWAALAFLEGHRLSGQDVYRQAGERVLDYALAELFDPQRGGFIAWNNPDHSGRSARTEDVPLAANGLMAQALLTAYRLSGRPAYRDAAERTLALLGGQIRARLVEAFDTPTALVAEMAYTLTAYNDLLEQISRARDRKSTRLNSSHPSRSRMPSSA